MLAGLTGVLNQENMDADKVEMLDVSFFTEDQEQANIIFDILSFISSEIFYPSSQLDKKLLLWMRTAVNAIVEVINQYVVHPFLDDGQRASEEFLKHCFNHIRVSSPTSFNLLNFLRVIIGFAKNFSLGIILISLILEEVQRNGELLINSCYSHINPGQITDNFRVYIRLLHSLLPDFGLVASSVIGVGNADKDKVVIPKVTLGEIRRFSCFLDNWAFVVDAVILGFSQVSKDTSDDLRQVKKLISNIKQKIFLKKIK